jgi:hypothetical protein
VFVFLLEFYNEMPLHKCVFTSSQIRKKVSEPDATSDASENINYLRYQVTNPTDATSEISAS